MLHLINKRNLWKWVRTLTKQSTMSTFRERESSSICNKLEPCNQSDAIPLHIIANFTYKLTIILHIISSWSLTYHKLDLYDAILSIACHTSIKSIMQNLAAPDACCRPHWMCYNFVFDFSINYQRPKAQIRRGFVWAHNEHFVIIRCMHVWTIT